MKIRIALVLLLAFSSITYSFSQEIKTISVKKKFKEADLFPRIDGRITGDITYKQIEDSPVIQTNSNLQIVAFELSIRIGSGEEKFYSKSNRITQEMLSKLANLKSGEPILFTNIIAQDELKRKVKLQPLMLNLR